jgi:hypothetical protein
MQFGIPLIVIDTRGPRNGLDSPTCLYDSFAFYMILHLFELSSIVKSSCDIWSTFLNVFLNLERNIMKF